MLLRLHSITLTNLDHDEGKDLLASLEKWLPPGKEKCSTEE